MKVKLLARKGANKAGTVLDLSATSAEFMVRHGYAEAVEEKKEEKTETKNVGGHTETVLGTGDEKPAARRGRPRKGE